MRYILGVCVVLSTANLTGLVERAHAFQAPAVGSTAPVPPVPGAVGAINNAVQGNTVAGTVNTQPPPLGTTTVTNASQAAGAPGTVIGNPTTTSGFAAPGTVTPGTTTYQTYSSYYVPGTQVVTVPGVANGGVNAVNPMGTTMPIGTYYSGAGVGPNGIWPRTTTYSSMYVTPGYRTTTQTYPIRTRGGLFGGLFGGRNRVYMTAPYTYSYGTVPGSYTYVQTPY